LIRVGRHTKVRIGFAVWVIHVLKVLADFRANVFTFLLTHEFSAIRRASSEATLPLPNDASSSQIVIVTRSMNGSWRSSGLPLPINPIGDTLP